MKTNFTRARRIVRAVTGITLSKRVVLDGLTIPDVTAADWDNPLTLDLLQCIETMNEEEESNGTTIADAPLYSRITSMRLNLQVVTGQQNIIRWLIMKRPDGETLATSLASATWHSSDDSPTMREIRKYTIAKGYMITSAAALVGRLPIFVSKQALKRVSPLRENDLISLLIAKDAPGTTATLHGFGTIWVRANA